MLTKSGIHNVIKAIGDLSHDGYFFYNTRAGTMEYTNNCLLEIFDISHASFSKEPAFFINHIETEDIDYLKSEFSRLENDHKVENIEFRLKCHDNGKKIVSCNAYLIEQGRYVVGIIRNISNQKQREDYIINYGAKKNSLLDMVTHNVSGPLTVSKNIIQSLENAVKKNDLKNVQSHIELIRNSTEHCIEIVTEFLEEEHLLSEEIYVKKNRFEVAEKLETILERIRKSYPDYQFIVHRSTSQIFIINDDVKFLQIANNLISNAIKFSKPGSSVDIKVEEDGHNVMIHFKDNGIGIPDNLKNELFQKYTPASREGLNGERSMGMGLYIVKKLAELMGGGVSFKSKENKGSTFTLTLPKGD
jgi:two-component system sensor histidine kinase VicK